MEAFGFQCSLKHIITLGTWTCSTLKISDVIPNWFWNLTFVIQYLDLSHDQISDQA